MKKASAHEMERFKEQLKGKDMKATPQRIAVHEAMIALVHASADQVSGYIARNSGTGITVTSVYNILNQMTEIGIYSKRTSKDNRMYFDIHTHNHVHLYDEVNHEYIDFDDRGLLEIVEKALKGRKVKGYRMDHAEIQVICRPTRKRRPA